MYNIGIPKQWSHNYEFCRTQTRFHSSLDVTLTLTFRLNGHFCRGFGQQTQDPVPKAYINKNSQTKVYMRSKLTNQLCAFVFSSELNTLALSAAPAHQWQSGNIVMKTVFRGLHGLTRIRFEPNSSIRSSVRCPTFSMMDTLFCTK